MDFSVPPALQSLLDRYRALVDEHVVPLEAKLLRDDFSALLPELERVRSHVREQGLWLPQLERSAGGLGLGLWAYGLVSEALGRSPLGHYVVNAQAPDAGNIELLLDHASTAQRQDWLTPLLAGEIRSAFAMTEPGRAGSNPVWMETTAARDGDTWVVRGRKWFTTGADGAAFVLVMAVTHPDASPHERASILLVPTDTPGFRLERNVSVMGHAGQGWLSHGEITFDDCRVPFANLLGTQGAGFALAQARLGPGRIHHCMRWLGICERAFDAMCERAATRELSPGELLGTRQTVQHWIAECRAEIDAARLLVLKTAWTIEREGIKNAREAVSLIKFHVADVMTRVLDRAIQTHGALGLTDDTILAFFYRHERAAHIYDGPDEVHKSLVARRLLARHGVQTRT